MNNPIFQEINGRGNMGGFFQQLDQLKRSFNGDPMQAVQGMLNSGKVTQAQYDAAVKRAQEIMRYMR